MSSHNFLTETYPETALDHYFKSNEILTLLVSELPAHEVFCKRSALEKIEAEYHRLVLVDREIGGGQRLVPHSPHLVAR